MDLTKTRLPTIEPVSTMNALLLQVPADGAPALADERRLLQPDQRHVTAEEALVLVVVLFGLLLGGGGGGARRRVREAGAS